MPLDKSNRELPTNRTCRCLNFPLIQDQVRALSVECAQRYLEMCSDRGFCDVGAIHLMTWIVIQLTETDEGITEFQRRLDALRPSKHLQGVI